MNDFIELQKIVNAAIRNWWLLVAATIAGALLGLIFSQRQTPVYSASTTLLVGQSVQSTELDSRDMDISEQIALTYAQLARLQPVMQKTADRLGTDIPWQRLAERVRVTPVEGSQLLKISVEAASPEAASALADTVAEVLISLSPAAMQALELDENQHFAYERIEVLRANIEQGQQRVDELEASMLNANSTDRMQELQLEVDTIEALISGWENNFARMTDMIRQPRSPNSLSVVSPAQGSMDPIRPRTKVNMLVLGLAGFVQVLGIIVFRSVLDDTIRTTADFDDGLGIEALGAIGHIRGKDKLITARNPGSTISEAYAMVIAAIRTSFGNHPPTLILVTSPYANDGKSTTAANLGVVMAQSGFQTIVADMNFAHPSLHQIFKLPKDGGVTDALQSQKINVKSLLKKTDMETLQVLTIGTLLPTGKKNTNNGHSPQEDDIVRPQLNKLTSHLEQLLTSLSGFADVVILDGSPLLTTVDAATLSGQADGVVLVVEAGKTQSSAVRQAVAILQQVDANLMGGILNEVPRFSG